MTETLQLGDLVFEAFCYLGRRFSLKVVAKQEPPLQFDGTRFILRRDARPAEEHFRRWYLDTGTEWLRRRVERPLTRRAEHPTLNLAAIRCVDAAGG